MEQSEGNMSLKIPVTPPGIDPWTIRLVAQRLDHYVTIPLQDTYFLLNNKTTNSKYLATLKVRGKLSNI
jgi:hypothetical protein